MQPLVLMVPSSSKPANTVFLSVPPVSRRLHPALFFLRTKSVAARRQRESLMGKVRGLILAGETLAPTPLFILALLKYLQGGEERKEGGT